MINEYDLDKAPWNKNAFPEIFGGEIVVKKEAGNIIAVKNNIFRQNNCLVTALKHSTRKISQKTQMPTYN
ncbi:MAG: hypothetical protein M0R05_03180 [Bacilli bacterium]|nr:hypothetical protein [Bacilli bacterium]MDD4077584.1 hypothetical protein [Bacilli bacterium]